MAEKCLCFKQYEKFKQTEKNLFLTRDFLYRYVKFIVDACKYTVYNKNVCKDVVLKIHAFILLSKQKCMKMKLCFFKCDDLK